MHPNTHSYVRVLSTTMFIVPLPAVGEASAGAFFGGAAKVQACSSVLAATPVLPPVGHLPPPYLSSDEDEDPILFLFPDKTRPKLPLRTVLSCAVCGKLFTALSSVSFVGRSFFDRRFHDFVFKTTALSMPQDPRKKRW